MAEADIAIVRIVPETSFKNKAYEALKEAILKMDIYATPEPVMLRRARVVRTSRRQPDPDPRSDRDAGAGRLRQNRATPRHRCRAPYQERDRRYDPRLGRAREHGCAIDHDYRAQKGHLGAARFLQGFRQGPSAAGSRRGILQSQHRLSPGADFAQRIACSGRYDQRHPVACARLPATDDRARRPHRDVRCRNTSR